MSGETLGVLKASAQDAAGRPTFGIRSDACSYPFPPGKTARGTDFGPLQPHPFAEETRTLLKALACGRSHIRYSSSDPEDQPGVDFDAAGRLNLRVLQEPGVPRNGDFYICGPPTFMSDLTAGFAAWSDAPNRIQTEIFGTGPSITPGVAASPRWPPYLPAEPPGAGPLVSFARSGRRAERGSATLVRPAS